jgi:ATP-dependent Clp protease ATP-binding subunit ClpA
LVLQINARLGRREISVSLDPSAEGILLSRAVRHLRHGAWILVRMFRRFILFPVADLAESGKLAAGSHIVVRADDDDRLRFDTLPDGPRSTPVSVLERPFEVAVAWEETAADLRR